MANLEELVISLVAETSGLRAELNSAAKATKDATSKMDAAVAEFSKNSVQNVSFFETSMATMTGFLASEAVLGVIEHVKEAFAFLAEELKHGVEEAAKSDDAFRRLATSLQLTGQYNEDAFESLKQYAEELEHKVGIDEAASASTLALLSAMTKLNADGLQQAHTLAVDLAAAMNLDLDTAVRLVGKGIEGSTEAFKRYGIEVREGETRVERLANITRALASEQGTAVKNADSFSGSLRLMTAAYDSLLKEIGNFIVKNPAVIEMVKAVTQQLANMKEGLGGSETAMRAVGVILITFAESGKLLFTVLSALNDFFMYFKASLKGVEIAIMGMVEGIEGAIKGMIGLPVAMLGAITGIEGLKKAGATLTEDTLGGKGFRGTKQAAEELYEMVNSPPAFDAIIKGFDAISEAGSSGMAKIGVELAKTDEATKNHGTTVNELGESYKKALESFAQGLATQGMALDNFYKYNDDARKANLELELADLQGHNQNKWDLLAGDMETQQAMLEAQHAQEWTDLETARANNLVTETQFRAAQTALAQKQYLESKKIEADKTKLQVAEQAARTQGYLTFLDGISVLTQSSNKELQAIGKAAAITKATVDAYLAIQNALANVPYPANIAAAAGIGVMAFANVAKIAGIGFNEGGTLVGGGANRDSVPATLTKGETVITRDLTDKLGEYLDSRGGASGASGRVIVELSLKDSLIEFIEAKIIERQANNTSLLLSSS